MPRRKDLRGENLRSLVFEPDIAACPDVIWSGGFLLGHWLIEHPHDVALFHDQEIDSIELDLGARPFAEQHEVAHFEVDRDELAGLIAAAWAYRGDLALGGLLLDGIGDDDAAG